MLAEMAAFEAERIGDTWREAHSRRVRMGLPKDGKPRFGYRVTDGQFEPDPEFGPVLAAMYRRYLNGESVYSLVGWLNQQGYVTAPGYRPDGPGAWTQTTLRRVLDSGFGAGLITYRGEVLPGAHEPVIDAGLWARYQATRTARRVTRSSERSQYTMSGMLRCVTPVDGEPCGSPMGGGQFGHARVEKYRCIAAAAERRHPGGYVMTTVVEDAVKDWLRERAGRVDRLSERARAKVHAVETRRLDAEAVAREVIALDQQLTRLTLQFSRDVIPESAYVAARDEVAFAKGELEVRHAKLLLAAQESDAGPLAADLLMDWEVLSPGERRTLLRKLVRVVEVLPGRPRSEVNVIPAWAVGDKTR
jgi:site-specific DNA recombinase